MRSRPGISLPNFTQCTMRVPGFTGSLCAGAGVGSQDSLAMPLSCAFLSFDSGLITLNEYLDRTLFYRSRPFSREEFTAFMFAQSKEYPETRAILDKVTNTQKYFVGAINNEPLELNQYRIEAFDLRRNFLVFFSSCYLHSRKPEETIFRIALEVTQRPPEQCLFIDDRPLNLERPGKLGMNTILHQGAEQLRLQLGKYGVEV